MRKVFLKRIIQSVTIMLTTMIIAIVCCHCIIMFSAKNRCYDNLSDLPFHEYGLLLGTSPITPQGEHNYYFDTRIQATVELYHHGKIRRIIASGGNYIDQGGCNELTAMRDSLIACNIPDSAIILDYQGTRTLYSILQAKTICNHTNVTIISQKYHNERAIYLARHYGLEAVAYNAKTPDIWNKRLKNELREYLARVKVFIDLIKLK